MVHDRYERRLKQMRECNAPEMIINSNIFFYILVVLCITAFNKVTPYLIIKYMNIHNNDKDFFYIKYNIFIAVFNIVFSLMIIFLEPDKILLLYICFQFFAIYLVPHILISYLFIVVSIGGEGMSKFHMSWQVS